MAAPRQPMELPINEIVTYPSFAFAIEDEEEDGEKIRLLVITTIPGGKRMRFPFAEEMAVKCGQQLSAPSVEVATHIPDPDSNGTPTP